MMKKEWGLLSLIAGIVLIAYGMSLAGRFDIENQYFLKGGSIVFGLIFLIIGGLILFPNKIVDN